MSVYYKHGEYCITKYDNKTELFAGMIQVIQEIFEEEDDIERTNKYENYKELMLVKKW